MSDKGNRSAFADENGALAEPGFQSFVRYLKKWVRIGRYPGLATAQKLEIALNLLGKQLPYVALDQFRDFGGILIGNEPGGKFGVRFRGDDGLCAFADIASPDAVEFQRWPDPKLFN